MEKRNIVKEKSYAVALLIVDFCWKMQKALKEFVLSRQLLKSGTSQRLLRDVEEIIALLTRIIKSSKDTLEA